MANLLASVETARACLLQNSWQASRLAVMIFALPWLFRKQLSPKWVSALLLLTKMLLPITPESRFSIFDGLD